MTEEESARNPSVSQDRTVPEIFAPVPVAQQEPIATNGTSPEAQAGLVSHGTNQVCNPCNANIHASLISSSDAGRLGRVH